MTTKTAPESAVNVLAQIQDLSWLDKLWLFIKLDKPSRASLKTQMQAFKQVPIDEKLESDPARFSEYSAVFKTVLTSVENESCVLPNKVQQVIRQHIAAKE